MKFNITVNAKAENNPEDYDLEDDVSPIEVASEIENELTDKLVDEGYSDVNVTVTPAE